jgi:hypothetical protein
MPLGPSFTFVQAMAICWYPATELAVLSHERWQVELVIEETRNVMRLSERTLRSLTPEGVIQEIYVLLLAHTLLRAAQTQGISSASPRPCASWMTTCQVTAPCRAQMVELALQDIAGQRLPTQRVRIQARVLKRSHSCSADKEPEHWHAPPLELDLGFHQSIAFLRRLNRGWRVIFFEPY